MRWRSHGAGSATWRVCSIERGARRGSGQQFQAERLGDGLEVAPIGRRDTRELESLGYGDDRGIDETQAKFGILAIQLGDAPILLAGKIRDEIVTFRKAAVEDQLSLGPEPPPEKMIPVSSRTAIQRRRRNRVFLRISSAFSAVSFWPLAKAPPPAGAFAVSCRM